MGQSSSIHHTWQIEYYLEDPLGYSDKQIDRWKDHYRTLAYVAPLIIIGLLWTGQVLAHYARDSRRDKAIRHLLELDKARSKYDSRRPQMLDRKDTSLSSSSTLVDESFEEAPPSKPLPPLPPQSHHAFHRRSRSASEARRRSIAFDLDMPYVSENSRRSPNSFGSSDSNVTLATKSDLPMLHIKRDTSRLQVIHRGPLRTVGAIISAYSRTWLTWQRWEIMGQSFDINQIVWILGYFSLTLLFGFINTPSIDQFTKTNVTIHRVSSLSVGQLPLIIGLAGKNNVISAVTGISYERLNFLHRTSARVFWLYSLYHFGGHIYCGMTGRHAWQQLYVWCGVVALICFTLIAIISLPPIRSRCYEFFLISHIVLVALGMVFLLLHRLEYWPYYVVGMLLWSLDRLTRFLRLVVLNKMWRFMYGTVLQDNVARVESMSQGALLKVTMKRDFGWKSGKHAFVMMPTISRFPWEAHPFTIALMHHLDEARTGEVMFLIGVQGGFTRRLLDRVSRAGGVLEVPCLVEAPYGTTDDLSAYDEVVLCAGGAGVTYTLNRLFELCDLRIKQQTCVQRVHFVWSVRTLDSLDWIAPYLAEAIQATPPGFIQFHIYVTRVGSHEKGPAALDTPFGRAARGRPDYESLLGSIIWDCAGSLAVHSCGPGPMSTNIAATLSKVYSAEEVAKGGASVDFHAETFGM